MQTRPRIARPGSPLASAARRIRRRALRAAAPDPPRDRPIPGPSAASSASTNGVSAAFATNSPSTSIGWIERCQRSPRMHRAAATRGPASAGDASSECFGVRSTQVERCTLWFPTRCRLAAAARRGVADRRCGDDAARDPERRGAGRRDVPGTSRRARTRRRRHHRSDQQQPADRHARSLLTIRARPAASTPRRRAARRAGPGRRCCPAHRARAGRRRPADRA
jgi:hypothetical protein